MSQELITQAAQAQQIGFGRTGALAAGANVGAVAIEQERAIAEAQGQLIMAKRFPRDMNKAHAALMVSCKSRAFADVAFYTVPNRGTGPSIRFAEEVARVFQNFEFGHRELSRSEGKSEIEVYAWDKEDNNRSIRQITVMHVTDTRNGPKKLIDQADIDNKIANVASKQVRGRILALMPKWLVEDAIQECRKTIAGNNDEPIEARIRKMVQVFAKYGVTPEHIEGYLGHKLDKTLPDEIADLTGIFNAIKEGTPASEFFGTSEAEAAQDPAGTGAALAASAKQTTAKPAGKAAAKGGSKPEKQDSKTPEEPAKAATVETAASQQATEPASEEQPDAQEAAAAETEQQADADQQADDSPAFDPAEDDVF